MSKVTLKDAQEGLLFLGIWMDFRYNRVDVEPPIQKWKMPQKEKAFFTVYAMNLVLEGDGFECLATQNSEDLKAFISLLNRLGATKTSALVEMTLKTFKTKTPAEEKECTREYYALFRREKVWLKLMDYIGSRIYLRYCSRAQAIGAAGGNVLNPKEWQGNLPDA